MKAISFTQHALPIDNPQALIDISLPRPTPGPRDLLVEVRAVSVNPVDTKVRVGTITKEPLLNSEWMPGRIRLSLSEP